MLDEPQAAENPFQKKKKKKNWTGISLADPFLASPPWFQETINVMEIPCKEDLSCFSDMMHCRDDGSIFIPETPQKQRSVGKCR